MCATIPTIELSQNALLSCYTVFCDYRRALRVFERACGARIGASCFRKLIRAPRRCTTSPHSRRTSPDGVCDPRPEFGYS